MAILPAQVIAAEMKNGRLITNGTPDNIEACSYDLRIGTIFSNGKTTNEFVLPPGGVVSMFTKEQLELPDDICATVFALNAQSSKGLLVLNPGHVDPGYIGPITVKVLNISKHEKVLKLGEKIFTAVFDRIDVKTIQPYKNSTQSRNQRETDFVENDLHISPGTLTKLVGEPTDEHVQKLIRNYWTSWCANIALLGTLVFAVIAALPVFREAKEKVTESSKSPLSSMERPIVAPQPQVSSNRTSQAAPTASSGATPVVALVQQKVEK